MRPYAPGERRSVPSTGGGDHSIHPMTPAPAAGPSARYLEALFAQSPVGIAVMDVDLRLVTVNAAMAALSGVPVADHAGRRVRDVLPLLPVDVEPVMRRVLAAGDSEVVLAELGTGELGTRDAPTRDRTEDGPQNQVFEVACYRVEDDDGTPLGVVAFLTDVSARERARDAFAAAQFRLTLVGEASARIGSTLDLDRTAREVVDVAVPRFADAAVVDVHEWLLLPEGAPSDPSGPVRAYRMAVAAQRAELLADLPDQPGDLVRHEPGSPAWAALTDATTVHAADPCDTTLRLAACGPDVEGVCSTVFAPLVARGRVLGVAGFTRAPSSRPFDDLDRTLAEQLAARAATAVDNARLYAKERSTALTLQRSLLPHDSPRLTGVEVASRYLPGSVATEVGGDWYDVIPLSCGRVALVVGDVMGRGLRAAASMGQLRTAVRTLAVLDLTPDDVIAQLDHVAGNFDGVQLATCLYAVFDPVARSLTYASAGHLPPAVLRPDGDVTFLRLPSGAPLAVGGVPFESECIELTDGSTVVLYTDGLVESRLRDVDTGMRELHDAIVAAPRPLEQMCDALLQSMGGQAGSSDDVALLVGRLTGVPADRTAAWSVQSDLSAVARSRALVARQLAAWGLSALSDTALLLVSELVTNAIRYARMPVRLQLMRLDAHLVCAVTDSDARLPRLRHAGADDEGGRGLQLVGTLARRWGARPTDAGKVVWFELPLVR